MKMDVLLPWKAFFHVCYLRCGHKEAVFFQSHSMKAEVISAVYGLHWCYSLA